MATFAKQLYSGFSLMENPQKTGFSPSIGQALGFVESQNLGKHNILCFLQECSHNILHYNCLRIMDLGVVK